MLQPNEFRYTLTIPASDKKDYVLLTAPVGWEDNTEVEFNRSETQAGMIRNITVPLEFTFEGAKLLRNQFYRFGAQSVVYIHIEKLNTSTWQYETAYYGRLDFSKPKDGLSTFTVNAVDADLSVKLKKFENTRYEIPVENGIDVELTPLKLVESAKFIFLPSLTDQQPGYTAITVEVNEVKSVVASVKDAGYRDDPSPDFSTSNDWFYTAQTDTTVNVKLEDVQGFVQSFLTGGNRFRLQLVKNNGTVVAEFFDISINNTVQGFSFSNELSVALTTGEKLFLYQRQDGTANSNTGFNWTNGTLSISYDTISPATKCKALRPLELFKQIVKKINGGFDYPIQSFLLQEWEQLTVTCGDAIRQLPDAKIKTTLAEFFKSISAVTCAGMAVENGKVTLEYRQSYFRNSKSVSMLDSKDVTIEPANDLLFNTIKTGYPNQTYDEVNGKDEVNSMQYYEVDVFGIQKELDISSIYRADAYGAQFLAINLEGKATTDNDADNDPFFLYVNKLPEVGGYYQVETATSAGYTIENVLAGDTYYNWRISPHRNLIRWGGYIRSIFYNNPGYQIRFTSGDKNVLMKSTGDGTFVVENSNVLIASLAPAYFQPYYAMFTTKLPYDFWRFINTGVYGYGDFTFRDVVLKGYFMNANIDLAMNSEREFKLLITSDNNLLELI